MFDTLKLYGSIALLAIVGIFMALFSYRGSRIDSLTDDLQTAKGKAEVVDKVIKEDRRVQEVNVDNKIAKAKAEARDYEEISGSFYSL